MTIEELSSELDLIDLQIDDLSAQLNELEQKRQDIHKAWTRARHNRIIKANQLLKLEAEEATV